MNKIKIIKFTDAIIGRPFTWLFPKSQKAPREILSKVQNVLIVRPGGIGDAVLLMPALNFLKRELPDARIDILCEKRNADIFLHSKSIYRMYIYDKGLDLVRSLRNRYDVVIDTEQWHRMSAIAAYFTGATVRIGFDTNERRSLFTHRIPYSHDDYEIFSFFHLIQPLIEKTPEFNLDSPFLEASDPSLHVLSDSLKEKDRIISIFPGASVDERRWGGNKFGRVAKILNDKGYKIVILGTHTERREADTIKSDAKDHIDLVGKTKLMDIASILKISRLLLTADSGLMHIAYAVGTPTVSLFGAGREKKWAPTGPQHTVLNKHLACSPCTKFGYTPPCKKQVECLSSISVDEVIKAIENLLQT